MPVRALLHRHGPTLTAKEDEMETRRIRLWAGLLAVTLIGSCAQSPEERIIGEWKGTDHTGETASLAFDADGTARMIQGDVVLDGNAVGGTVTWRMDADQDPMHLDLVVTDAFGETQVLPMIVRFISETKIELCKSEDGSSRPSAFSDSDKVNQITLTKQ
jgi:uncharacterized protein (TIGR03067 family)